MSRTINCSKENFVADLLPPEKVTTDNVFWKLKDEGILEHLIDIIRLCEHGPLNPFSILETVLHILIATAK